MNTTICPTKMYKGSFQWLYIEIIFPWRFNHKTASCRRGIKCFLFDLAPSVQGKIGQNNSKNIKKALIDQAKSPLQSSIVFPTVTCQLPLENLQAGEKGILYFSPINAHLQLVIQKHTATPNSIQLSSANAAVRQANKCSLTFRRPP